MKNNYRVTIFLRLTQCITFAAILFVVATVGFAQAQEPQNTHAQGETKAQQKEPPKTQIEVKQIPAIAL